MATHVGLSFRDLVIRVSEALGSPAFDSSGAITLPSGYTLDRCKRIVNDRWREFVASNPDSIGWKFLDQVVSITFDPDGAGPRNIDGDPGRYRAPGWFSDMPKRPWQYVEQTIRSEVRWATEATIMGKRARDPSYASYPELVCARRIPVEDSKEIGYEFIFWPSPTEAEVIQTTVRAQPYEMTLTDGTETHFAGREYDFAVLASCLAGAEVERYERRGDRWRLWTEALEKAIIQNRQAVTSLEPNGGSGAGAMGWQHDPSDIVYNGESVTETTD